jgi:hypothetical protein
MVVPSTFCSCMTQQQLPKGQLIPVEHSYRSPRHAITSWSKHVTSDNSVGSSRRHRCFLHIH